MTETVAKVEVDSDLIALFVVEVDTAAPRLQELVLSIEADGAGPSDAEDAMRIAHSLKGAARIVGLTEIVATLHAAEDALSSAQGGRALSPAEIQALLRLVDLLVELTRVSVSDFARWLARKRGALEEVQGVLRRSNEPRVATVVVKHPPERESVPVPSATPEARALRLSADSVSRLLGLAGETVVEARRLHAWSRSTAAVERAHAHVVARASDVRNRARSNDDSGLASLVDQLVADVEAANRLLAEARDGATQGLQRLLDAGERLYHESLRARQRPFAQVLVSIRRHVRDTARALGKSAKLDVAGAATPVDGDVLGPVEAILQHLITNALDHGLEAPAARAELGKPTQGTVAVELRHARGQLSLHVTDDGRGIDHEKIRAAVIAKGLIDEVTARSLGRAELLEMLFLPGFSTAKELSVHSGRGVGLDAVRSECARIGGRVSIVSEVGKFTRFELTLPVTRVVVRALLVRIAGDVYALPLAHAGRVVRIAMADVHNSEGRDYVEFDGENVGVIRADEVLEVGRSLERPEHLTLVLLGEWGARYGLAVDAALGEDDLVVRPLDPRLGRVADVGAAALLADGSPTLVLDVADLLLSMEKFSRRRGATLLRGVAAPPNGVGRKRVLVVDDSMTVRAVQRQLLTSRGYEVDEAADGVEAWSMLRARAYHVAVVDVDMPRMNGLELVRAVRADRRLARLPVVIVSYKEGEEDRARGIEAGANQYLAKGSFHDEQLAKAVRALIGESP